MRGFRIELMAGVAAIAIGLLLPFAAGAAKADDMRSAMKENLDANHDGVVSDAERNAARQARFKAADANGDGFVTREEFAAAGPARDAGRKNKMFASMDGNGDGKVSKAEFDAASANMRERMKAARQD